VREGGRRPPLHPPCVCVRECVCKGIVLSCAIGLVCYRVGALSGLCAIYFVCYRDVGYRVGALSHRALTEPARWRRPLQYPRDRRLGTPESPWGRQNHGSVGGWDPVPVLPLATGPRCISTPRGNLGPPVGSVAGHVSGHSRRG